MEGVGREIIYYTMEVFAIGEGEGEATSVNCAEVFMVFSIYTL